MTFTDATHRPTADGRTEATRTAGVTGAELDWAAASDYRDYMIRHLDDKAQVDGYARQGATVIKAEARITGPGTLKAGDRTIHADHISIATGSETVVPDLEGAGDVAVWTNREAFTATTLPQRAVARRSRRGGTARRQRGPRRGRGPAVPWSSTTAPRSVPTSSFSQQAAGPEIAAAGITQAQADERGLSTAFAEPDLAESLARPSTYEQEPRGNPGLLTDTDKGVLIGAWAVSPLAGEWIHQVSLAIRARIPIAVLHDQVGQFTSYSEAFQVALDRPKYRKKLV